MDTDGNTGKRRARNRFVWMLLAAAVVVAVGPALLRDTDADTPPTVRVSTQPITADFRHFYNLTIPERTPAYVVAAGRVGSEEWFIVAYEDPQGRPCVSKRGVFGTQDGGCPTHVDASAPVYLLGGSGDDRGFLEYGLTRPEVRTVVFLTDDARNWSTPAVPIGKSKFRFFAALDPRRGSSGIPEMAWKGDDGLLHRNTDTSVAVPSLCPKSEAPLQGTPDGLPMAGATKFAHADAAVFASKSTLLERFHATDARVEPRNGQVWLAPRGQAKVADAADALIRLYLASPSDCPASPHYFEGIPLSFAIGPAPALPELNKAYPISPKSPLPTQAPEPVGK